MTTEPYGGYPPPTAESPGSTGSVADTAKDQAAGVASTTADQARNVAGEARTQARTLITETRTQVNQQAAVQKDKAVGGLRRLAGDLRSMADNGQQSGMASDLAREAADKAHELAGWLEGRQPGDVLTELRDLARRRPGAFLLGAAAAGVLAGRLTRSAVDIQRDDSSQSVGGAHDYPVPSGSEWATATRPPVGDPTIGLGPEHETTSVSPERYATATGRGAGTDRL